MVPLVLCADDYAMTPAVSRGILALLEAGRMTATGAMTNRPSWPEAARDLRAMAGTADLGVHLSLTCGEALTAGEGWTENRAQPKLPALLARAVAGALPLDAIMREIEAQLDAFEQAMGMRPDFIDGHQHVHALPGIRRALLAVLARRYPGREPWIRDPGDSPAAIRARGRFARKARLLALLAGPFSRRMAEAGFRLNRGFAGYSAFDPAADYGADFASYLVAPGPAHLVMCHPGEVDDALRALDPATDSRLTELAFFRSDRFSEICAAAGMQLARMAG
ncbi:MAG: ChbG/HpnK family deacetylase [Beijerinckiaceae bacterium]|nr:ChbG/HpnK family deacetylase [Beijerinckiaceae bacterium]